MTTTRIPNVFGQSEKQTFVPHRLPFSKIALMGGEVSKNRIQTEDGDYGMKIVLGGQRLYYFPLRGGHCMRRWFYTQDQLGVEVSHGNVPSQETSHQKLIVSPDDILKHLFTNGDHLEENATFAFVGKLDVLHEQSFPGRSTTNWALHVRERVQFAPTPTSFLRQVPYVVMPVKEDTVQSFNGFDILGYILKIGTEQVFVSQARLDAFQSYKTQLESEIRSESITFSMDVLHYEITHAVYYKQLAPPISEGGGVDPDDYAWTTFSSGWSNQNSIQRGYQHVSQLWENHDASSRPFDNTNLRQALRRADSHTITFVDLMQAMPSILASHPPQEYYGHTPSMLATFQSVYSLEYDLKHGRLPAAFVEKAQEFGRRGFPIDDDLRAFLRELVDEFSRRLPLRISGGGESSDEQKLRGMLTFIKAIYFKVGQVLKETPSGAVEPTSPNEAPGNEADIVSERDGSVAEEEESSYESVAGDDESNSDAEEDQPTHSNVMLVGTSSEVVEPTSPNEALGNEVNILSGRDGSDAEEHGPAKVKSAVSNAKRIGVKLLQGAGAIAVVAAYGALEFVGDTSDRLVYEDPMTYMTRTNLEGVFASTGYLVESLVEHLTPTDESSSLYANITKYSVNKPQMCWANDTSTIVVENGTIVANMTDSANSVTGIITAPIVEIGDTQFNPQRLNFSDIDNFLTTTNGPKFDFVRVAAFVQALDPDYYYSQLGTPIWEIWNQKSWHAIITDQREQWLSELRNIERVLVEEHHRQKTRQILAQFNISLNADETFPTLVYPIAEISIPVYLAITILREQNDETHNKVIYNLARVLRVVNIYKVCARDRNQIQTDPPTKVYSPNMYDSILTTPSELYEACTLPVHTSKHTPNFAVISRFIERMTTSMPLNNLTYVNSTWYPLVRDGVLEKLPNVTSIFGGGSGNQFAWSTHSLPPLLANLMLKIGQKPTSENARQWVNVIMQAQRMLRFGRQSKFPGIFGVRKQKKEIE